MTHEETLEFYRNIVKLTSHPQYEEITRDGAHFIDPDRVYVSKNGKLILDKGTVVATEVYLLGIIRIGKNCIIGPGQILYNVEMGDCVQVGARPNIQNSYLGRRSKIGRLAEIVRSAIGQDTAVQHFSYIGDAAVNDSVNIGAGVVIANYNGSEKCLSSIGTGAFIGSNSTLIAPLDVGHESFVGAGSIIRKNVEPNSVVVGVDRTLQGRKSYKISGKWTIVKPDFVRHFVTSNDVPEA